MDTSLRLGGTACDSFVVVSRYLHSKRPCTAFVYDPYQRLEDAVAHFRRTDAGYRMDFDPVGVFPAKDGLPIGPAMDMATINAVMPGALATFGAREYEPNTPENLAGRERAVAMARRAA